MSTVMHRESDAVRAALGAEDRRYALRSAIREILAQGLPTATLIEILEELADEYRTAGERDVVRAITEALDVLYGQISDYAISSYLG